MNTRTWAYGTTRRVEVVSIARLGKVLCVGCVEVAAKAGADREGFVLIDGEDGFPDSLAEGVHRTIVFVAGGPTGGHWTFAPMPAKGGHR